MSKIYQIISSIQLGGAELVAFNLARFCGKYLGDGVELELIEIYPTNSSYAQSKKEELKSDNIKVTTLFKGQKRVSLIFAPLKLFMHIRKEKPDIIHSHTDLPDFVLSVLLRMFRLLKLNFPKIVRTIHNTQLWRSHHLLGKITESALFNESVVSVSSYAMVAYEELRRKYNLQISDDRQIIYNGCPVPGKIAHPFKIDNNKINIAFCGRFEDYKGMETVISALNYIGEKYPDNFLFHLIGDGTYKNKLLNLAEERSDLILYNPVPNVSNMLYAFDFLFMPSHFEGLGLTSIEASLAHTPVIASFAPGLDETLPDNWPLRFHLNNDDELYSIFDKIYKREFDMEKIREIAFDFVINKFSLDKMIQRYSNLYSRML